MTLKKTDFSVKGQKRHSDFWSLLDGDAGRNNLNAIINGYTLFYYCLLLYLFFFFFFLSMLSSLNFIPCPAPTIFLVSSGPLVNMFNCSSLTLQAYPSSDKEPQLYHSYMVAS